MDKAYVIKRKKLRTRKHLDEIRRKSYVCSSERIISEKMAYDIKPNNIFTSQYITLPTKAVCSKTVNRTIENKKIYNVDHEKVLDTNLFRKGSAKTAKQVLNYSGDKTTSPHHIDELHTCLKAGNMKHTNLIDSLSSPIIYDCNNSILDNSREMIDGIVKHGILDISEDVMENNRLAFFAIIQNNRNSAIERNIIQQDHRVSPTSIYNDIILDHIKESPKYKFLKETESSDNTKSPEISFNVNIATVTPITQQTPECVYFPHKLNH